MRLGKNRPQSDYERLFATILDVYAVDYWVQVTFYDDNLAHLDVGRFRVDFVLDNRSVVVELDGADHLQWRKRRIDRMRDEFLRSRGFTVIRITNKELDDDLRIVANRIYKIVFGDS